MGKRRGIPTLVLLLLVAAGGWTLTHRGAGPVSQAKTPLGLFTSLPILWSEQSDLRDVLAQSAPPHWVRGVLERQGKVVALDTLTDLAQFDRLVIAQPRPLSGMENVALDEWVRSGGKVLLFADPMLTHDSAFGLGDRRRPQDVVLVSPILGRWGLELQFDEAQPGGMREIAGEAMPVNLAGQLAHSSGGTDARCRIGPEQLIARCVIGKGRAIVVADAAVLEAQNGGNARAERLESLIADAFMR